MQQRRLRLGDILDDYCPRERRITNHVVVAMIDDEVKQTRCTTCDADHEYKHARIPPQRRKRVGSGTGDTAEGAGRLRPVDEETALPDEMASADAESNDSFVEASAPPGEEVPADEPVAAGPADDDGPVHRRLIRATLPRPDGQPPDRKDPEFTIRQPGMRGPGGRRRHQRGAREQGGSLSRFDGPRHGSGQGPRHAGGGAGHGHRPPGNRPGSHQGSRGNRQGPGAGRGGRKRGR
ncbi:MAG: hypothetical protein ACRD3C_25320 [Vicinamibacterales bacterium]